MYGCATTRYLHAQINAFDTRAVHRIIKFCYSHHISKVKVTAKLGYVHLLHMVIKYQLSFIPWSCSAANGDHYHAVQALSHWK